MYTSLGWLTERQLAIYHTALTVYKIRQSSEPESMSIYLKPELVFLQKASKKVL